jgi:hypothetical protein
MTDMHQQLALAKSCLSQNAHLKCVLCKNGQFYESEKRGVAPMLDFLDAGLALDGFSAADRVVGRATAYLFVLAGVGAVYSDVMSTGACEVLERFGIHHEARETVPYIINRRGDGMCPMEAAVLSLDDPNEAHRAIRRTLQALQKQA